MTDTTLNLAHVVAAVATELAVPTPIAARIVEDNAERIARYRMPSAVEAFGYAGDQGQHLTLTVSGQTICELKVSAASIDEIVAHRTYKAA